MDEKDKPAPTNDEAENETPAAVQWMMQQASAGQSSLALPSPVDDLPVPALAPFSTERQLAEREQRIADALQGNDRLTDGLPGEAAQSLLEWGLELARNIVRDTAGLADAAAEDILQPRVRAVRRLMMAVGQATGNIDESTDFDAWLKQAAIALGDRFSPPDMVQAEDLRQQWRALTGQPQMQIALLRDFIEQLAKPRS